MIAQTISILYLVLVIRATPYENDMDDVLITICTFYLFSLFFTFFHLFSLVFTFLHFLLIVTIANHFSISTWYSLDQHLVHIDGRVRHASRSGRGGCVEQRC